MAKDPLKVVVRLLPPEITEEELLATLGQAHAERTKWRSFVPGKRYKGEAKASLNARCYFKFEALEYAEEFIKDYHGHQFVDGQGEQFRAVACFAPYQKVPRTKPQKDPREGSILDDPQFKEFVESLSSTVVYEAPPDPKVLLKPLDYGDTPLLKFMQTRAKERRARKEKQDKRRWREMESIAEDPKKAKWRCAECGTSKHLEEDPDDRGTFYCTYCWDSWETQAAGPKVKKKKKKSKEQGDAEVAEETEEATTKKKKKKKDKDREAEEPKSEWRAKEKPSQGAEEEEEAEKRRRKKKEAAAEEEEDRGKGNRWRVKKPGAPEEAAEPRGKAKKSQKGGQEEWWEEERGHKRSDRRSEKQEPDAAAEDGTRRWRAKGSTASAEDGHAEQHEEKSRRRPRKGEGGEGQWRPKS